MEEYIISFMVEEKHVTDLLNIINHQIPYKELIQVANTGLLGNKWRIQFKTRDVYDLYSAIHEAGYEELPINSIDTHLVKRESK